MATFSRSLFLDTQICIDKAKERISRDEWKRVWRYIREHFEYCISPLTFMELLRGLARGKTEFFQKNLESLRVLVAPGKRRFLRMPGEFVMSHALDKTPAKPGFDRNDFEMWSKVIFRARNPKSLELGNVRFRYISRKEFGFSFKTVAKQHEEGIKAHQRDLEALRRGELAIPPTREKWAAVILKSLNVSPSLTESRCFGLALDAAYFYDTYLWALVVKSDYNLDKNRTDWIDQQQLYYLADERMHFLTRDRRIISRTAGSSQVSRIFSWDEFLAMAEPKR